MSVSFNLQEHGVTVAEVHRNLPIGALYEHAVRHEKDASILDNGALAAYSGVKTGRSPKDKRVVKHPNSEAEVWWGPVNIPIEPHIFARKSKPPARLTLKASWRTRMMKWRPVISSTTSLVHRTGGDGF
jgi:ATP-dependent phosphoenolpyruvate carboxykinase